MCIQVFRQLSSVANWFETKGSFPFHSHQTSEDKIMHCTCREMCLTFVVPDMLCLSQVICDGKGTQKTLIFLITELRVQRDSKEFQYSEKWLWRGSEEWEYVCEFQQTNTMIQCACVCVSMFIWEMNTNIMYSAWELKDALCWYWLWQSCTLSVFPLSLGKVHRDKSSLLELASIRPIFQGKTLASVVC